MTVDRASATSGTLAGFTRELAERYGKRAAFVIPGAEGDRCVSYAELGELVARAADGLAAARLATR